MWLLIAREPLPDAPQWRGRRVLALLDAVGWPLLVALLVHDSADDLGLVGQVVLGACALLCIRRVTRAIWRNGQYRFTTERIATLIAFLCIVGALLKFTA